MPKTRDFQLTSLRSKLFIEFHFLYYHAEFIYNKFAGSPGRDNSIPSRVGKISKQVGCLGQRRRYRNINVIITLVNDPLTRSCECVPTQLRRYQASQERLTLLEVENTVSGIRVTFEYLIQVSAWMHLTNQCAFHINNRGGIS